MRSPYFSTNTSANLRQHERGKHGKGQKAACCRRFDWSAKMFRHKKTCSQCLELKERASRAAEKLVDKVAKNILVPLTFITFFKTMCSK